MTQQESMAKLFSVFWLTFSLALLNACEYESKNSACSQDQKTVQEGGILHVSLSNFGMIRDVCVWNSTMSKWESACHFSDDGTCKHLIYNFNMNISVENKTLVMSNMEVENSGLYRIRVESGNCRDIRVSVLDSKLRNSGNRNVFIWGVIRILLLIVSIFL